MPPCSAVLEFGVFCRCVLRPLNYVHEKCVHDRGSCLRMLRQGSARVYFSPCEHCWVAYLRASDLYTGRNIGSQHDCHVCMYLYISNERLRDISPVSACTGEAA